MSGAPADATVDPELRSWVPGTGAGDFPIQNLPYGVFQQRERTPRAGIAIGDHIVDLAEAAQSRLFDDVPGLPPDVFNAPALNGFMALGRDVWSALRRRVSRLLSESDRTIRDQPGLAERVLVGRSEAMLLLPVAVGDFVDFYSSLEHALNMGRVFRPGSDPLPPAWRHLPIGYHGRAGSIVVGGTPITRPHGQLERASGRPEWAATEKLDFELEVGFITGTGNRKGTRIRTTETGEHIFGLVLVNDWSARDIQAFEYVPLGPFLGKSFATSISPWIVPLDAVKPFMTTGPEQTPPVPDYLRTTEDWAIDIDLEVGLGADDMVAPDVVCRTNFRNLYWNLAQQLAHATSNGAPARPGDLFASGTISGSDPGSYGSLAELTEGGAKPLRLSNGTDRTFVEDGDTVSMRAACGGPPGPVIGFGTLENRIEPAGGLG
ncbi:MAG: fumarylacetoacetase [Actinobacteria bacterium]|nr:fumarylacetoacetase [Actinomycetota bacterium]